MESEESGKVFQSLLLQFHTLSEFGILRFFHWEKTKSFSFKIIIRIGSLIYKVSW